MSDLTSIMDAMIIQIGTTVYLLFDRTELFVEGFTKLEADNKRLLTILASTVNQKVINLVSASNSAYEAFKYLKVK